MYKSDFLYEIDSRGFIYQFSDNENLDKLRKSFVGNVCARRISQIDINI